MAVGRRTCLLCYDSWSPSGVTHQPAGVAQLVEQLIRNQQVRGSSPRAGSKLVTSTIAERTGIVVAAALCG